MTYCRLVTNVKEDIFRSAKPDVIRVVNGDRKYICFKTYFTSCVPQINTMFPLFLIANKFVCDVFDASDHREDYVVTYSVYDDESTIAVGNIEPPFNKFGITLPQLDPGVYWLDIKYTYLNISSTSRFIISVSE